MEIAQAQRPLQYYPAPPPAVRSEPFAPVTEAARARAQTESRSDGNQRNGSTSTATSQQRVGDVVDRSITLDPDTNTFVFQALNAKGEVVLQFPDQVLLRSRAYDRQIASEQPATTVIDEQA